MTNEEKYKAYLKQYRLKHLKKLKAYHREWVNKNRASINARHRKYYADGDSIERGVNRWEKSKLKKWAKQGRLTEYGYLKIDINATCPCLWCECSRGKEIQGNTYGSTDDSQEIVGT